MHTPSGARTAHAPPLELLELSMDEVDVAVEPGASPPARSRRRRTFVVATGIVVVGGLAAFGAWRIGHTEPAPQPDALVTAPAAPAPLTPPAPPQGIEGFAELYLSTYLTAAGPDRQTAVARYYPAAPEMERRTSFDRYVTRAVVVEVAAAGSDVWELTLAAEVLTFDGQIYVLDGTHYYTVAVAAREDRPFAATSLPVRVAAPPGGEIPAIVVGAPVVDQSLQTLATSFLAAYTTGADDISRYITAAAGIAPIHPAPFATIAVDDITAVQVTTEQLQIRIAGAATPVTGAPIRIEYHMLVEMEGGAWKVADLSSGPLTVGQLAEAENAARRTGGEG